MTTAIAERPTSTIPTDQLELIRRTVAAGATDTELQLFLYDCSRRGVHPLDRLLHFTKRGGRYTPVTSIDFMRSQAAISGEMAGSDDPTFSLTEDGKLISSTVTVYRLTQGQRFAYSATARWSEYCPDNAPMWKRMPHTMLGKCAEALALRKAFPQQLAGLYSREEMDQADKAEPQGYVVEAPAATVARAAAIPPTQSGGDSEGRPVRAEVPADADLSAGSKSLPAGARIILRVGPGVAGSKAELTFNAPVGESGKAVLLTYKEQLRALAEQLCQDGDPCFVGLRQSATGNWRVEDLMRVPPDYAIPEPKAALTAEDIAF